MILVSAFWLSVVAVCCLATSRFNNERLLRSRLKSQIIVTLRSGVSFRGVFYDSDRRVVVLRDAEALEVTDTGTRVPVDGEMILAWSEILYMQKP